MDENVAKNDLLKELEAVVVVMRKGSPRQAIDAFDFLSTHHAEIAEAVRVNRAVREVAENWRVLARVSGSKVDRYAFKFFAYQLDAAIDAHNSAREDGE